MTRRSLPTRLAAWLGIARKPTRPNIAEHDLSRDPENCPRCAWLDAKS